MSEPRDIRMKLEREDTPTRSIRERWMYEIFVRHFKLTMTIFISLCVFYAVGFALVIVVMGTEKWYLGFVGIFILLWWIIKYIGLGIWFIVSRAWITFFFAPLVYFIIKYFIHVDKVGFRELGSANTYFFKVTTTTDGYLLHQDKFFGLMKTPIYLDKATVQYFKENGSERIFKEKGKKDNAFLELDIVPLSWRGDSLLIKDEESDKLFLNNSILVTEHVRDYYALVVKGFSPSERESEKQVIYDKILNTSELNKQIIQLKRELKEQDVSLIELIAPSLIPHDTDEFRRFKGFLKETTRDYDRVTDRIEQKTAIAEKLMKTTKTQGPLTDEEVARLVAIEELD